MKQSRIKSLEQIFEHALTEIQTHADLASLSSIAVAYSGGLDSAVLLRLAHTYAQNSNLKLHAFHIHHGLSPNADRWLEHCRTTCEALGVAFDSRRVALQQGG